MACKNGPKCEAKKQLTDADPKQVRGLLQYLRGHKNMMFYRTVKTPKTNTSMAALPCKKKGQKVAKEASGI